MLKRAIDTRRRQPFHRYRTAWIVLAHLFMYSSHAEVIDYDERAVRHGQYLVRISGCNDCHTPGYRENNGNIPMDQWLIGNPFVWRGPWGAASPSNLRAYVSHMTEAQWIADGPRMQCLPPMPWYNLNVMSDFDLRAIYLFIKSLDEANQNTLAGLTPEQVSAKQDASLQAQIPTKIQLEKQETSTYYAWASVMGGAETLFMIDTGAAYTTISENLFEDLEKDGVVRYQRALIAIMADGSERSIKLYTIGKLTLGGHCNFHDVEVAVIPGNTRSILGMNLLKRSQFMIDAESESISLMCKSVAPPVQLGPDL